MNQSSVSQGVIDDGGVRGAASLCRPAAEEPEGFFIAPLPLLPKLDEPIGLDLGALVPRLLLAEKISIFAYSAGVNCSFTVDYKVSQKRKHLIWQFQALKIHLQPPSFLWSGSLNSPADIFLGITRRFVSPFPLSGMSVATTRFWFWGRTH